jgi:5-methylthioadenosine/S-adenosylhomocysteine deaminase
MPNEVLLRNGYVVTMDDSRGDIAGGDVLLRDDKIVEVGQGLSTSETLK